jgi:hypothetical protein
MRAVVLVILGIMLVGCGSSATSMAEPDGEWVRVNTPEFLAEGADPAPAPRPLPPRVRRWRTYR